MNNQNNLPKVSICIVTYNQENYIRQCLKSIVNQERNFIVEVIVSDDCSKDKTPNIISEFAEKYNFIKPIFHKTNIGAFNNFVETHNLAKGEYVCHLDGDDVFLPQKLQKQLDTMEKGGFSISWHKVHFFSDNHDFYDGNTMNYGFLPNYRVTLSDAFALGSIGVHSSVMYKRSARKTFTAPFPPLDFFYSWEYLESGNGIVIPEVLGGYRLNANGSISNNKALEIANLTIKHYQFFFKKHLNLRSQFFILSLTNFLISVKNKKYSSALKFLNISLKTWSFINPIFFIKHLHNRRKITFPPKVMVKKYDISNLIT